MPIYDRGAKNALTIFRYQEFTMARGKQPPVSHALPKQQTLLDCFLEAQANRLGRRSAKRQAVGGPSDDAAPSGDETRNVADEEAAE
ncbi:hypothetical protein ACQR1W_32230 [Bradyrhizobium sp. HKCCYLS1011]|uniref:hypothetical protein n=1 Tax=Bradyrhizobium sp. HKCCYLS1011 TaxID=3420733 RepID=UPI003EBA573B